MTVRDMIHGLYTVICFVHCGIQETLRRQFASWNHNVWSEWSEVIPQSGPEGTLGTLFYLCGVQLNTSITSSLLSTWPTHSGDLHTVPETG